MIMISYDIHDNKKRSRFNRYIKRFGHRLQFSVYQIDNSERVLDNIMVDIENKFLKDFDEDDSVYVFKMSQTCKIKKFGYAKNEDFSFIVVK